MGSPNNGPLRFLILMLVSISLLYGVFFPSFHVGFTLSFGLQMALKGQQTVALILIETDSVPKPRAGPRPRAVVLRNQKRHHVEGDRSQTSASRRTRHFCPSQMRSDTRLACQSVLIYWSEEKAGNPRCVHSPNIYPVSQGAPNTKGTVVSNPEARCLSVLLL